MAFESVVLPEDQRYAMTVSLYKGKGERIERKNYRAISLLNVIVKIYAGMLVDSPQSVTKGFIYNEQGGFRL